MKQLFSPQQFCVLDSSYFKIVMESAFLWTTLPYPIEDGKPAWYRRGIVGLFQRVYGVKVTGFKVNYPEKISGNELVDEVASIPVDSLFIPQSIYDIIQTIQPHSCIVEASHYGLVKVPHLNYGVIPEFCLLVSKFVEKIDKKELYKIKAIDAFVAGC